MSTIPTANPSVLTKEQEPIATKIPDVFLSLPKCDPSASPLTKEEGNTAVKELTKDQFLKLKFPRVQRLRTDPPCPGNQVYSLFTFVPSANATPDRDGNYGIIKIRGTFPNTQEMNQWSENLIRNVDSLNEIYQGYVGKDMPLTTQDKYCKVEEIDLREQMNDISKDDVRKKREMEDREKKSIEDRRTALMEESKDVKDKCADPLDYYITMRVKRASIRSMQEETEKKLKEYGKLLKEHNRTIHELDDKNPTFEKDYKEKYMKKIRDIGGDEKSNPLMKYL